MCLREYFWLKRYNIVTERNIRNKVRSGERCREIWSWCVRQESVIRHGVLSYAIVEDWTDRHALQVAVTGDTIER